MPVTEQAQQLIEAVGGDLEEIGFRCPGAGHDGAPAVKRRLHQLQIRVIGGGGEPQISLSEALAELVVNDGNRGQPGGPTFVHSRRVRHLETDFLVRLVVPDGESGESPRVDGKGLARRLRRRYVEATRVGWVIADGPLAVQGDEVAAKPGIRGDEPEKALHPGRAVVGGRLGLVGDGRSTEPDRDSSLINCLRRRTVECEVVVRRSLPEPSLVRFIPDLEPPVSDRLRPEAGSVASSRKKARTSVFQRSQAAGGRIGDEETAGGKKPSTTNGIRPRVVRASRASKVVAKSIGRSTRVQTLPPLSGMNASRWPAVKAPKKRTPWNAPGEAARLSSNRVN